MKWEDDEYKHVKWTIFNLIKENLLYEHSKTLTIKELTDSIDIFFDACKSGKGI